MDQKDQTFLTPEDINRFLNAVPKSYQDKRGQKALNVKQFQLLYKISYYCALKISETLNLEKSDFDLENRTLKVHSGMKGDRETTIPPVLIGELRSYLENSADETLFNISRSGVWGSAKKVLKTAGLQIFKQTTRREGTGIFLAVFRRSYQTQMFRDGANEYLVNLKLRIPSEFGYGGYSLEDLKEWEKKHYKEFLYEEERSDHLHWYDDNQELYKRLASKVEQIIREILDSKEIGYHYVNSRAKDIDSFEKKLREGIHYKAKEMQDLAGIRVICYVKTEVDEICDIIEKSFDINKEKSLDKSKILGKNVVGYQSIHYIAKFPEERTKLPEFKQFDGIYFEIQVRTILQHAWAEIEHDKIYKSTEVLPKDITRQFFLLSGVLEIADNEFEQLYQSYPSVLKTKTKSMPKNP